MFYDDYKFKKHIITLNGEDYIKVEDLPEIIEEVASRSLSPLIHNYVATSLVVMGLVSKKKE